MQTRCVMKIRTRIISLAIAALMLAALAALVVPAAALPVYEPSKGYASGKYYASLSAYAPTGDQRYDTVAIALTQLGYHEGDSDLDFDGMNTSGGKNFVEYNRIFGKVEYQSVSSASLLSNWFSHIATGVMSVKLNSLLKADWKQVDESVASKVTVSGDEVKFRLDAMNTPLVNGATVTMNTDSRYFNPIESEGPFPGSITVGKLVQPASDKTFFPNFVELGGGQYEAKVALLSPYADEISRLQGVCGEVAGQGDAVNLNRIDSGKLPSASVWNSTLPIWLWVIIILIILAIIASFVYQFLFTKLNRKWMVFVKASSPDGTSKRYNLDEVVAPITIGGADTDLPVKDAKWSIKVFTERHNPALFFLKSGYYMVLEQGDFADVQTDNDYDPRTVSVGEKVFLYKAGKSGSVTVKIGERGKTRYQIDLS